MPGEDEIKTQLRQLTRQVQSLREEIRASLKRPQRRPLEDWEVRDKPEQTPRRHT